MTSKDVVCAGYTVVDAVIASTAAVVHRGGGTAANVATNLSWLGTRRVQLAARLGNDPAGRLVKTELESFGVSTAHLKLDADVQTPVLIQEVTGSREPRYLFRCPSCARASSKFRPIQTADAESFVIHPPAVFFFDRASAAALIVASAVRDTGGVVMFEPNGMGREALTVRAAQLATVLKVSGARGERLAGLFAYGGPGQLQIQTQGADGLSWTISGGQWQQEAGYQADAVDTSGAGDWVTSGFLHASIESKSMSRNQIRDALRFGQALAATACEYSGARGLSSAPQSEVKERLRARGAKAMKPQAIITVPWDHRSGLKCGLCLAESGEAQATEGRVRLSATVM